MESHVGTASTKVRITTLATLPDPVGVVTAVNDGETGVQLEWVAPYNGGSTIVRYALLVTHLETGDASVLVTNTTQLQAVVEGLLPGGSYQFQIASINSVGTSNYGVASLVALILSEIIPDPGTDSGTDPGSDSDSGADPDSSTDFNTGTDSDSGANSGPGLDVDPDAKPGKGPQLKPELAESGYGNSPDLTIALSIMLFLAGVAVTVLRRRVA